jgi:hypothetical protein
MLGFALTESVLIVAGTVLVVLHCILRYARGWFARTSGRPKWFVYPRLWIIDWLGAIGMWLWAIFMYRISHTLWLMMAIMLFGLLVTSWLMAREARRAKPMA